MTTSDLNRLWPSVDAIVRIGPSNSKKYGESYGIRTVEHYELDYITDGQGFITTDGEKIEAKKGRLFLRHPGMVVEGFGSYHCYYLKFAPNWLDYDTMSNSEKAHSLPTYVDLHELSLVEGLFDAIYKKYLQEPTNHSFEDRTRILQIFLMVYEAFSTNSIIGSNDFNQNVSNSSITKVMNAIKSNPTKSYSLEELADMSGYNKHYFCRLFKKYTKTSPMAYLNRCRINHVKQMLIETENPIKSLCLESGYDNEAYFFRMFKKMTGTTPTAYRFKHRDMYRQ